MLLRCLFISSPLIPSTLIFSPPLLLTPHTLPPLRSP